MLTEKGRYTLREICLARSGDKGDTANIGVLARGPRAYKFLQQYLTAERVKAIFGELCLGAVTRYELENMKGFNFLLEEALGGGGTKSLRLDPQGKAFAQGLLRQQVDIPLNVLAEVHGFDSVLAYITSRTKERMRYTLSWMWDTARSVTPGLAA
jgi:hypothetical protein